MPHEQRAQQRDTPLSNTRRAATRDRILAYIKENRVAYVQALSQAWGLTRADIRYHFNGLVADGLIERVPRDFNQPAPRGRPEQQYRLAAGSTPNNFPALCSALLDALISPLPAVEREPALHALAGRLAGSFVRVPGFTQRLNQACVYLSQHGYRARWEAHASGPRILLRACPYAALLPTHPELCTLDRFFLEHLADISFQQTAQINLAGGKPTACIFTGKLDS